MSTRDLKIDLHPIYDKGELIEEAVAQGIDRAKERGLSRIEIVCGKGSGQLKKRVLRFLDRKEVRGRYHRVKKDPKNPGRIFVYFKDKTKEI